VCLSIDSIACACNVSDETLQLQLVLVDNAGGETRVGVSKQDTVGDLVTLYASKLNIADTDMNRDYGSLAQHTLAELQLRSDDYIYFGWLTAINEENVCINKLVYMRLNAYFVLRFSFRR
jgi:hypothetical protein